MISALEVREVKRNVATGGGTIPAISAIRSSEMTPGPLGISDTNPRAEAPAAIAAVASEDDEMQHIFTRGAFMVGMGGANRLWPTL
jgi:hypothetical protein